MADDEAKKTRAPQKELILLPHKCLNHAEPTVVDCLVTLVLYRFCTVKFNEKNDYM